MKLDVGRVRLGGGVKAHIAQGGKERIERTIGGIRARGARPASSDLEGLGRGGVIKFFLFRQHRGQHFYQGDVFLGHRLIIGDALP